MPSSLLVHALLCRVFLVSSQSGFVLEDFMKYDQQNDVVRVKQDVNFTHLLSHSTQRTNQWILWLFVTNKNAEYLPTYL